LIQRIFLSLAILALAATTLRGDEVQQLAANVDRRYNHLTTLTADFTEIYKGAGVQRAESGTLWLKKPGKMRWEYRQPREKLFITDGSKAYFYVPGEHQARQAPVKKLDDLRSPLRYLLGKTKLEKEFENLALAQQAPEQAGDVVLQGVPRAMADRVSRALLEVSVDGTIHRIVIEEVDGSVTEFRFRNQQENVAVSDSSFRFRPPPGVEMIQAEDVGEY